MHYTSLYNYRGSAFYICCIFLHISILAFLIKNKTSPRNAVCCTFSNSSKGSVTHQIPSTHTVPLFLKQEINSLSCHQSQNLQFSGEVVTCREEHLRNRALRSPRRHGCGFMSVSILLKQGPFCVQSILLVQSRGTWFVVAPNEKQIKASKSGGELPAQTELWMNISGAQLASEADWDNKSGRESNVTPCQPLHNSIKKDHLFSAVYFSLFTIYGTKYVFNKNMRKNASKTCLYSQDRVH